MQSDSKNKKAGHLYGNPAISLRPAAFRTLVTQSLALLFSAYIRKNSTLLVMAIHGNYNCLIYIAIAANLRIC